MVRVYGHLYLLSSQSLYQGCSVFQLYVHYKHRSRSYNEIIIFTYFYEPRLREYLIPRVQYTVLYRLVYQVKQTQYSQTETCSGSHGNIKWSLFSLNIFYSKENDWVRHKTWHNPLRIHEHDLYITYITVYCLKQYNSSHILSPAQYSLTAQNHGPKHHSFHLISPGCPRPSIALQCRIVA